MTLNREFRAKAYRAYYDQTKERYDKKCDEIAIHASMHEWDRVREECAQLAVFAQILLDTENKLADFEP